MDKLNAIIIDDEAAAREVLFTLLFRHCPNVNVTGQAEDLESGVEMIKSQRPDLVFLDVQMPSFYGYEIDRFFSVIDFNIIFVTAYEQYALRAFELSAIDYLLKPINVDRLKQSVKKASQIQEVKFAKEQLANFNDFLNRKKANKIAIRNQRDKYFIEIDQIAALKAEASYTRIFTRDKKEHLISKNLKQTSHYFEGWDDFFRCHKSWLINLNDVKTVSKEHFEITMNTGIVAKLSRYKSAEFSQTLKKRIT